MFYLPRLRFGGNMIFKKAQPSDFNYVYNMMLRARQKLFEENIFQWDERYPKPEMIRYDIENGYTSLVEVGSKIVAFYTSNSICEDDVHEHIKWSYTGDKWIILHRLCIDPQYQNHGLGQEILTKFENDSVMQAFESIRIDVFSTNQKAIHIYEKYGYKRLGEAVCERGLFYIYDKIL